MSKQSNCVSPAGSVRHARVRSWLIMGLGLALLVTLGAGAQGVQPAAAAPSPVLCQRGRRTSCALGSDRPSGWRDGRGRIATGSIATQLPHSSIHVATATFQPTSWWTGGMPFELRSATVSCAGAGSSINLSTGDATLAK